MTDGTGGAQAGGAAIFSAVGSASGTGAYVPFAFNLATTVTSRIVTCLSDDRVAVVTRIRETASWPS